MASYFFINGEGEQEGPVVADDLRSLIADGLVAKDAMVSKGGGPWKEAHEFQELAPARNLGGVTLKSYAIPPPKAPASSNPPYFAFFVILTLCTLWPIGLVASLIYLCNPQHRMGGVAMFFITLISAWLSWIVWLGRWF